MLYQGPEGSSTPGKPVLTLLQVSVLLIYAEPNHGERHSDATAVACGGVWLNLNTFPHAENGLLRTRCLINTWKTSFAIATCQCSGHLCWMNPWIETFWCYCSGTQCWLTRSEHLSTCWISSTNDQKAPQHLEKQVLPLWQFTVMAIYNESNYE